MWMSISLKQFTLTPKYHLNGLHAVFGHHWGDSESNWTVGAVVANLTTTVTTASSRNVTSTTTSSRNFTSTPTSSRSFTSTPTSSRSSKEPSWSPNATIKNTQIIKEASVCCSSIWRQSLECLSITIIIRDTTSCHYHHHKHHHLSQSTFYTFLLTLIPYIFFYRFLFHALYQYMHCKTSIAKITTFTNTNSHSYDGEGEHPRRLPTWTTSLPSLSS